MTKKQLGLEIADHGRWEEFHQKRGNFGMYRYHKAMRLKLQGEYNRLYREGQEERTWQT